MSVMLKIHHIDVGQGDATLIIVKDGQNKANSGSKILQAVLIDGGDTKPVAQRILTYLRKKLMHWPSAATKPELKTLDAIINTHYHQDHWGGLPVIIKSELCGVDAETKIYDQGTLNRPNGYKTTITKMKDEKNINWKTEKVSDFSRTTGKKDLNYLLKEGVIFNSDGVNMQCIAVNRYVINDSYKQIAEYSEYGSDANQRSLAFMIRYNKFFYYTGGDICIPEEKQIAAYFNTLLDPPPMQAFKVSHHGSIHSTPEELVATAKEPCVAFISYGDNTYDHPKSIVLKSLKENENIKKIYLTGNLDFNGMKGVGDLESFINDMVLLKPAHQEKFSEEEIKYLKSNQYIEKETNSDDFGVTFKFFELKDKEQMEDPSSTEVNKLTVFSKLTKILSTVKLNINIGLDSKQNTRNVVPGTIVLTIDKDASTNGNLTVNYDRFQYKEDENIKNADIEKILEIMFKCGNTEELQKKMLNIVLPIISDTGTDDEKKIDSIKSNTEIKAELKDKIFDTIIDSTYIYILANKIIENCPENSRKREREGVPVSEKKRIERALMAIKNNYIYISDNFISQIRAKIYPNPEKWYIRIKNNEENTLKLASFIQAEFLEQAELQLKNSIIKIIKIRSIKKKIRLFFGEGFDDKIGEIRKITDTILK